MEQTQVIDLGRQALQVGLMVSLPILAVSLFLGILVSIFQAITQVQEVTLTFVPKILGAGLMMLLLGNWMLTTLVSFTTACLQRAGQIGL